MADVVRNLNMLDLSNNKLFIYPLPPEIGQLQSVHTLIFKGNQLDQVVPAFGDLNSLTHIDVSSNEFTTIPADLLKLSKLKTFIASA